MEKKDLEEQLPNCPLRIRMNEGREYDVEKPEFIMIGSYTASVLIRKDGAMRPVLLTMVNITSVEPLGEPADS